MLYLIKVFNVKAYINMSSKEVATVVKQIIDDYWAVEIDKDEASRQICEIMKKKEYRIKIFRGNEKTAVFIRVMGARRLLVFDELYSTEAEKKVDMSEG